MAQECRNHTELGCDACRLNAAVSALRQVFPVFNSQLSCLPGDLRPRNPHYEPWLTLEWGQRRSHFNRAVSWMTTFALYPFRDLGKLSHMLCLIS